MSRILRLGTRRSALALWQTQWVRSLLQAAYPELQFKICPIVTQGDRQATQSLARIGGKGVFIKEIEEALLREEIDLAVHSMKDVPTELPEGLTIAAIPERGDVRDVLVSASGDPLDRLPPQPRIGTGSARRQVQIRHLRPDAQVCDIRGNVDTRLKKLRAGDYDAIVLAAAGLQRLGQASVVTEVFSAQQMVPAVGQAAIGVECRSDDAQVLHWLRAIDHAPTSLAVSAERAFLKRLGGGCRLPIGATAWLNQARRLEILGMVATDGQIRRQSLQGDPGDPEALGIQLAEFFL